MPNPDLSTVDQIEDALFAGALADFVATRNERARALRKAGRRDDAAQVAALRRPAVAAWALDQVTRREPELVRDALALGATMREAMQGAFGGDAAALRTLQPQERAMVAELARRAAAVLAEAGSPANATVQQRITDTARAALADEAIGEQLRTGRLVDEHAPAGFGFGGGDADAVSVFAVAPRAVARRPRAAAHADHEHADHEQAAREQAAREQAAREQAAREQAAREQAAREQAAREAAERARLARRRVADELRAEAERLETFAVAREAEATQARRAADAARDAAVAAERAADDAAQQTTG